MTLKEAIERTIELHQVIIDGEYETYADAKEHNKTGCPLCDYDDSKVDEDVPGDCSNCPYIIFTGVTCRKGENYNRKTRSYNYQNSVGSLIRLRTWLDRVERWGLE